MGEEVIDEEGAESGECRRIEAMGLLPLRTVFEKEKIRTRSEGSLAELDGVFAPLSGKCIFGYEIHMGRTEIACPEGPAGTARLVPDRKEPEICRPMCYLLKGIQSRCSRMAGIEETVTELMSMAYLMLRVWRIRW